MYLSQCRPTGPFFFLATSYSGGIRVTWVGSLLRPWAGILKEAADVALPEEACRQIPSSEGVKGQGKSALRLGMGQAPHLASK